MQNPLVVGGPSSLGRVASAAITLVACSDPGSSFVADRPADESTSLADAQPDAPLDATADASSPPADGSADANAEVGRDAPLAPDAGGGCPVPPQMRPDAAPMCGDGWRDPNEECDEGERPDAAEAVFGCSLACQVRDDLATLSSTLEGGAPNPPRTLGGGRHPVAVGDTSFAVAYLELDQRPPQISLASFSRNGVGMGVSTPFTAQSTVVTNSDAVVAGLPCDRYVTAWADFGGDGDELGVALRLVDPAQAAPEGPPAFANVTTTLSQFEPDLVWTGSQLVVVWTDEANVQTAPDVRFRTFDASLFPTSGEETLAATADSEADAALASFAGSWAAAWRDDANPLETIRVHAAAGSIDWTVGPTSFPGPFGEKPALAELDAAHLLLAFATGADGSDAGVSSGSKLEVAVLDTAEPGLVVAQDVPPSAGLDAGESGLAQSEVSALRVGARVFVAWKTAALPGDPNGEELWLKELLWDARHATLDLSVPEVPLPRWPEHRLGDQRRAALAASPLAPEAAIASAWDDLGRAFGAAEGNGDVARELIPLPLLRLPGGDGGP